MSDSHFGLELSHIKSNLRKKATVIIGKLSFINQTPAIIPAGPAGLAL